MREKMLEIAAELTRRADYCERNFATRESTIALRHVAAAFSKVLKGDPMQAENDSAQPQPSRLTLPRYRCHKVVGALKIKEILLVGTGFNLVPHELGHFPIWVPAQWYVEKKPHVGGYYVVYDDGYASFSPATPFEEGYTLIDEEATTPVEESYPGPTSEGLAELASDETNVIHSMPQKPTKGRIVLYTFPAREMHYGSTDNGQTATVPAIIVEVWSDTCVNLRVFQDGGANPDWRTSVPLKDKSVEDYGNYGNYWEWPARS